MKKFNPEKELQKVNNKSIRGNNSKLSNMYVPLLVIACSCLAMSAITFSAKLEEETEEKYTIKINIVNGEQDVYLTKVKEGEFSTSINSKNSFGSLECEKGNLDFDSLNGVISSPYVNQNIVCTLVFVEEEVRELSPDGLEGVNDNLGRSYYYKADALNNYVKIKDKLYRILRINGNGSYRLISNNAIGTMKYGESNDYLDSQVKTLVEDWFKVNFNNEEYLVEGDFDITNYMDVEVNNLVNFDGYLSNFVGLPSIKEMKLIIDDVESNKLLEIGSSLYLANGNGTDNVYAYKNNKFVSVLPNEVLEVRPVINVKAEFTGKGTVEDPFVIKVN